MTMILVDGNVIRLHHVTINCSLQQRQRVHTLNRYGNPMQSVSDGETVRACEIMLLNLLESWHSRAVGQTHLDHLIIAYKTKLLQQ
ncbi:hypothetical protein ES702_01479 [subsurface metagenome]